MNETGWICIPYSGWIRIRKIRIPELNLNFYFEQEGPVQHTLKISI